MVPGRWATSPGEVSHLHHDHTHLFSQHDDVIAVVVPFSHFGIQLALLLSEAFHLLSNLGLLLLGKLRHDGLQETHTWDTQEATQREAVKNYIRVE